MLDIILTFNTYVEIDGKDIYDRTSIAKLYARTWLAIDISSVIGLPLTGLESSSGTTDVVRTVKVLKFPKLLRLIRVFNVIKILKILKHQELLKGLLSEKVGSLSQFG